MRPLDDLLPEEREARYEELITLLQQANHSPLLVDPTQRAQLLSRVRTRLLRTDLQASSTGAIPVAANGGLASPPNTPDAQTGTQRPARQFVRLLNALAAVLVVGALVGGMLLLLASHRPHPAGGIAEKGCIASSKTAFAHDYYLSAVAALARNDIWVMGSYFDPPRDPHALLEHWNGSQWCIHPDPYQLTRTDGTQSASLRAVAAVSTNDIWAVGNVEGDGEGPLGHTLIEHWNGSRWSVVPSPTIGTGGRLTAVAAISPTDAWAIGLYTPDISGDQRTLIEHWNGRQWSIVANSFSSFFTEFHGITAISANDVWAVGTYTNGTQVVRNRTWAIATRTNGTLVVHWDGKRWSIVPSPNPGQASNALWGVTALSASDMWAVGGYSDDTQGQSVDKSLTLHWNGSRWNVVLSPNPNALGNDLTSVTARSANDVWAVGTPYNVLVEHWDGSRWSVIKSNATYGPTLAAIALVPHSTTLVAVGVGLLQYFKDPDGASLAQP